MSVDNKSTFNQLIEDNIKTASGQPKTTGPGLATLFRSIRDTIYGAGRVESVKTDDPSGEGNPVSYQLGDVFDPEQRIGIDQDKVLQFKVDGEIKYIPIVNLDTSLEPAAGIGATHYFMNNNTTVTTITSEGVYVRAEGDTDAGDLNNLFTLENNKATYNGNKDFFKISVVGRIKAGNSQEVSIRVGVNGTTLANSQNVVKTDSGGQSGVITCQTLQELESGDYIEAYVANHDGTDDITVDELNVIITPID